ncbi:hypothetical protein HPP92_001673 [Vanilla planifolia]|uniref:LOB domain-containing protein n=1 Tax=Vanilla planifolia TaxID=51239 RepID=A0A835S861_VANPL|nr:hypothetical protein HPP92_001673 [Vanilla planifolia]
MSSSHSFQSAKSATNFPPPTPSPCAACKFLRRKCQPECLFAPYFLADQPQKFVSVHRVFGASNVTKLLNEIPPRDREDAVNSLAYEAEMRLRDPVYGCVGVISVLHHELRKLQLELSFARAELARYQTVASAGVIPFAGSPAGDLAAFQHAADVAGFESSRVGVNGSVGEGVAVWGMVGGQFAKTAPPAAASSMGEKHGIGPA